MTITICTADLTLQDHCDSIVALLDSYAGTPAGGSRPLNDEVRQTLVPKLREWPGTHAFLAKQESGATVGLATCFLGFSTFKAKPVLNLHDLVVAPDQQGQGIGSLLIEAVIERARQLDCAYVTLEVVGSNTGAQRLYRRHGFVGGQTVTPEEGVLFFRRALEDD